MSERCKTSEGLENLTFLLPQYMKANLNEKDGETDLPLKGRSSSGFLAIFYLLHYVMDLSTYIKK